VTCLIEVWPKKLTCQLDAPLEPEPQARQRAPDQFFAENSKGELNEYAQRGILHVGYHSTSRS
jgi:hypothetical protein